MLTGELRSQIDAIWNAFWSGGISNPMEVMEQLTYLLFLRRLDDLHTLEENKALRLKKPMARRVFPAGNDTRGRSFEDLRWSHFKHLAPGEMYIVVGEHVFPFLRTVGGDDSTYTHHMRDARFTIPTPGLLAKVVDMLDSVPMEDRDTKGDLYEYMLGKIAAAGQNGQFRTPRHIIRLMVELTAPTPKDIICDPASGTCGFLVASGEYLREKHPKLFQDDVAREHFHHAMFHGYDFDNTMLRIGSMNMALHGVDNPDIRYKDFYASGMDEKRLAALGTAPLKPLFDQIDASNDRKSLAETFARLQLVTDEAIVFTVGVGTDLKNRKRNVIYFGDPALGMGSADNYLKPDTQTIRDAYRKKVTDYFVMAGRSTAEAQAAADVILAIDIRIAAKKLSPVAKLDLNKTFVTMSFAELKSLLSNFDLDTYFGALGLPTDQPIIVSEVEALKERNAIFAEYPARDLKAYLRWELIQDTAAYLSPAFIEPSIAFSQAVYGKMDTQPRKFRVMGAVHELLGHPLSQLYVEKYVATETKPAVEDMVKRVKAEFRTRLIGNTWLTAPTRQYALEKLDKLSISVGYHLVKIGLLPTVREQGAGRRVLRDALDTFSNTYVALIELANSEKKSPRVLLKNIGVPAVTGPKIDGSRQYFFKRADMLSKKNAIAKTEGA